MIISKTIKLLTLGWFCSNSIRRNKVKNTVLTSIFFCLLMSFPLKVFAEEAPEESEVFEIVGGAVVGGDAYDEIMVKEGFSGDITLGAAGVATNRRSSKFGEYTGLDDDQGFVVGSTDLSYYRQGYFMNLQSEDLGLDNRSIFLESGKFNDYKLTVSFSQIPHLLWNESKTPFDGFGTNNLTLPSGFTRSTNASGISFSGVNDADLEVDSRDNLDVGYLKSFGNNQIRLGFTRVTKDGIRSLGGVIGTNAGGAKSITLPEAFDQKAEEGTITFSHNGEDGQIQLEYFVSLLDNKIGSVSFEDPFQGSLAFGAGTAPDQGVISRAPDNQYHRFSLTGGINLPKSTRISGIMEYGLSVQDEDLLSFSSGTGLDLLPRRTADAKIQTLHFSLNATSNPLPKLTTTAKFRHYQTINDTPKTIFLAIVNDTGSQVDSSNTRALFNLPYDYIQDKFNFDVAYRIFPSTNFKMGYDFNLLKRDFRAVESTVENTFKATLRSHYFSWANANANFSYGERDGENYDTSRVFESRHTPEFVTPGSFDAVPDLRRYDIADRSRLKIGTNLHISASSKLDFGISYNFLEDDYDESVLGLRNNQNQTVAVDANYSLGENGTIFAYYTHEDGESQQIGRSYNPFIPNAAFSINRNWEVLNENIGNTVGIGVNRSYYEGQLTFSADYSFSQNISDFSFMTGSSLTASESLPDVRSTLHRFQLQGEYLVSKTVSVGLNYLYENLSYDDFALDGFDPSAGSFNNNLVLLRGDITDYGAHVGWLYAKYHFGT
jgi:MtrB/PioB family decaheme-associated outer membrane protein